MDNNHTTVYESMIQQLKSNPKLVVLTAVVDAEVHKSSSTTALWIYWGTTSVIVKARENKVQFYIPMDEIGTSNFNYDDVHKIFTVEVPPPTLDEDFVDVQSDPSKLEIWSSNGWAKLDSFSGAPMREEAKHELRGAVLEAAKQPAQNELLELKARENAKQHLIRLLAPMTGSINPNGKTEVDFIDG